MSMNMVRTSAEDLAAAECALHAARVELRNWAAHCDRMVAEPEDAAAVGWQARRCARIVQSLLDEAELSMLGARMRGYDELAG